MQKLHQHLGADFLRLRAEKAGDFLLVVAEGEDPLQHTEHDSGTLCGKGQRAFFMPCEHPLCRSLPGVERSRPQVGNRLFMGSAPGIDVVVEVPEDQQISFPLCIGQDQVPPKIRCGIALKEVYQHALLGGAQMVPVLFEQDGGVVEHVTRVLAEVAEDPDRLFPGHFRDNIRK